MFEKCDYDDRIVCDNNTRNIIKSKLLDIQNEVDLNNIDCHFAEKNININSINLNEAQTRLDIYANISKLSIYLMNDYEFFTNVSLQSAFKCPLYNTSMDNLGYRRTKSTWTLYNKPSPDTIIDNIFKYCYYSYIVKIKKNKQMTLFGRNNNNKSYNSGNNVDNDMQNQSHYNERNQSPYRNKQKSSYRDKNQPPFRNETYFSNQKRSHFQNETNQNRPKQYENNEQFERNPPINLDLQANDYFQKPAVKNKQAEINKIDKQWECKVCETMNSEKDALCKACDSRRLQFVKWNCSQCTFLNEPTCFNCLVCGIVNENAIT